ncbi:MAG: glycosyltransferase family 9 protein, partial [Chloroflexi bacterium]
LSGELALGGLLGLLSSASIVISNDSGPLHLAIAADTPAVGIYWCGNFVNGAPPGRSRHRAVVSWQTHCPLCGAHIAADFARDKTQTCAHDACFVDEVSIEHVTHTASRLLDDIGWITGLSSWSSVERQPATAPVH